MAKAKRGRWSYRTGEKGVNRVRAYEKDGGILLEFYERSHGSIGPVRKRVSLRHEDRAKAKQQADELAAALRRRDTQQTSALTLHALFYNCYLKEVTPDKSKAKQRHDTTCAEMFCRCFGGNRNAQTLNIRDWMKFIRERRAGTLRPISLDADDVPIREVGDCQIRYDLKMLVAVLNFATMALDDYGNPLLMRNPLKGLAFPNGDVPQQPELSETAYQAMRRAASHVHPYFFNFLVVVHETGHRAASVRMLRWSDVDLVNNLITWRPVRADKKKRLHLAEISEEAVAALIAHRAKLGVIGDGWVFPSDRDATHPVPRHTVHKWWRRAETKAGLEHIPRMGFHGSRRKFVNEMETGGVPVRDVADLGGWASDEVVRTVYQRPQRDAHRAAFAARLRVREAKLATPTDTGTDTNNFVRLGGF